MLRGAAGGSKVGSRGIKKNLIEADRGGEIYSPFGYKISKPNSKDFK